MRNGKLTLATLCIALSFLAATEIASAVEPQTHKNSIGMEFVLIPAGSFMMGTDPNAEEVDSDETRQYSVTISKSFYLGKCEVTQAQWEAMMGDNPSQFKGRGNPVEQVSWDDAQEFIWRLNQREGHNRYRLPTEAEWELAARGGTNTRWFFGDRPGLLGQYAWFGGNSDGKTHPVGQKKPNPYGLYDIYGNVWEWTQDRYDGKDYANSPADAPKGPAKSTLRVIRGGS